MVMSMAKTQKSLNDELRAQWVRDVREYLSQEDEVLVVGANELAVPVVDSEGNEKWVVLTIKVPTGTRDGDAYDGYAMAEDYRMRQADKAAKAAERERKTAERQAKAKAKTKA
jgi:2-keto-3-deoxy-L-rhamnonate aldolase RhmA